MNKVILILILIAYSINGYGYDVSENIKMHGFLTQNAFYTSANNFYGESEDQVSTGLTEIGLNLSYQALDNLNFSFQGLYRRAGKVDSGSLNLDYGFADITLKNYQHGQWGLRLGRVKNPLGLYNETRDVAFTTPSIILPQGIYYDRSRSLLLSLDGGQFYADHQINNGNLSLKLNYGKARNDNDELMYTIIPYPEPNAPKGKLSPDSSKPFLVGQINYSVNEGEYLFALSYADVSLNYKPGLNDIFSAGDARVSLYILSAQYNGEKFSFTGEFLQQNNEFNNFGLYYPDNSPTAESWYLQTAYRIKHNWQVYLRYDEYYLDTEDKYGDRYAIIGQPKDMGFSQNIAMGLRWDINPSIMVRGEYHHVKGTAWLTTADNPDRSMTSKYWDIFALQVSFRF